MSNRDRAFWRAPAGPARATREHATLTRLLDDLAEALDFVRDPRLRERLMILAVVIQETIHACHTADGRDCHYEIGNAKRSAAKA